MLKNFKWIITSLTIILVSFCSKVDTRDMRKKDGSIELVVNNKKLKKYNYLLTTNEGYTAEVIEDDLICNIYLRDSKLNYENVEIRFDENWSIERLKNKENKKKYIHFYPNELSNQNILWIGNKMNGGGREYRCLPKCEDIYYFPITSIYTEVKVSRYNYFTLFLSIIPIITTIVCYNDPINLIFIWAIPTIGITILFYSLSSMLEEDGYLVPQEKEANCCTQGVFAPVYYIALAWTGLIFFIIGILYCFGYCLYSICKYIKKCNEETKELETQKGNVIQKASSVDDIMVVNHNGEKIEFSKKDLYHQLGLNDSLSRKSSLFHNQEIKKYKLENKVRKALKTTLENSSKTNVKVVVLSSDGEKIGEFIDSEFLKQVAYQLDA